MRVQKLEEMKVEREKRSLSSATNLQGTSYVCWIADCPPLSHRTSMAYLWSSSQSTIEACCCQISIRDYTYGFYHISIIMYHIHSKSLQYEMRTIIPRPQSGWISYPLASSWTEPMTAGCENSENVEQLKNYWLVVSTHLKNVSQIGSFPQVGVKI